MKTRSLAVAITAILFSAAAPLFGASQHTWVAWYGSDSNAGTQSEPFLTFQGAITQTSPGGVIAALTAGDYGAVTITQAVTIDGVPGASVTFTGGEGIYVDAGIGDTVTLRNLHVNGLGLGTDAVYVEQAANFVMENCVLENFTTIGLGIGDTSPITVSVRNTVIHGGELGFRSFQSQGLVARMKASLETVTITGASQAALFSRNGTLTITNSELAQSAIGLEVDSSSEIDAQNITLSENTTAVMPYVSAVIRLSSCALLNNHTVTGAGGGKLVTDGNNRLAGNIDVGPAPSTKLVLE